MENRRKGKEVGAEAKEKKKELRVEGTRSSHPIVDYAGQYVHPGYGTLGIEQNDGNLTVNFNGIAAPLEHWHYDVWTGAETEGDTTFEDQKFLFRGNEDGLIAEVTSVLELQPFDGSAPSRGGTPGVDGVRRGVRATGTPLARRAAATDGAVPRVPGRRPRNLAEEGPWLPGPAQRPAIPRQRHCRSQEGRARGSRA